MKHLKLLIANIFMISTQLGAQVILPNKIYLEVDPTAYFLKGYSIHGIYQYRKLSFDFGNWNVEEPKWVSGNKGFRERTSGLGIMANYHFNGIKGWLLGIGVDYSFFHAVLSLSSTSAYDQSLGIGPHIGYRFFLWNSTKGNLAGFYIKLWLGVSYNFQTDQIRFNNLYYKQNRVDYFPAVHLGYCF